MTTATTATTYQRTTTAIQFDTLDAIAYRVFGSDSSRYLSDLVELNPSFSPFAILPQRAVIILPIIPSTPIAPTLKLWD